MSRFFKTLGLAVLLTALALAFVTLAGGVGYLRWKAYQQNHPTATWWSYMLR